MPDVWRLSVWRLSVSYIGPKSRTERPRKTKIGTELDHVTRDSDTTFKVKRSKVIRPLYSPPCWRVRQLQRWAWECIGCEKLLLRCRLLGCARRCAHGEERGGAYRGGRPLTACFVWHSVIRNCSAQCENSCYGPRIAHCCHRECVGGCSGPSNTQCWVSMAYSHGSMSVRQTTQNSPGRQSFVIQKFLKCAVHVLQ